MAEISLDGTAAVVTGAARGLGLAMARALARAGASVVLVDVDGEAVDAAVSEEGDLSGGPIHGMVADVTKEEDRAAIAETCLEAFGRIDMLVNNAGVGLATIREDYAVNPIRPWEIEADDLLAFHAVHSVAPLRLAAAVLPAMCAQGRGRIVTVTTDFAVMARGTFTAYGGAKAASEAYMAGLAAELAGTDITVNAITPGGRVDTRMVPDRPGMDRDALLQPAVIGPPIVWLASDDADGVTARRFNAALWDTGLSPHAAAIRASAPIGWAGGI